MESCRPHPRSPRYAELGDRAHRRRRQRHAHCLTGCAIGEIAGVAIGTALGLGNFETIVLAIVLAFVFGYGLTSLPLLRAGLALGAVIPESLSRLGHSLDRDDGDRRQRDPAGRSPVPMDAGLADILFWGSLSFALAVAFVLTVPVNRWPISKGKGHTAVHETGIRRRPVTARRGRDLGHRRRLRHRGPDRRGGRRRR